jgi:hypothetical protein
MQFPLYLTSEGKQILDLVAKAHFNIRENISWCADGSYYGATIKENKTFFICTKTILKGSDPKRYLNETVYHEAVHVAQQCKGRNHLKPIGIPISQMPLPSNKMVDIQASIRLTKNKSMRQTEHEAFWLEDKPKQVIYYLKKFCF